MVAIAYDGTNRMIEWKTKSPSSITVKNIPSSDEFSGEGYTANLSVGEQINLSSIITGHNMTLAGIGDDNVTITVASTPTNYTIAVGATQKIDLDSDGVDYDMSIKLNSISGGSASLTIKSISEEINPTTSSGGGSSRVKTISDSQFAEGYTKELRKNYKMRQLRLLRPLKQQHWRLEI